MFDQNPHCGACKHMNMRGFCNLTACPFPFQVNIAIGSYDVKPKTNGDRIRSMTDEELAEWLVSIIECDDGCPCIKECGEKEEMGFCYPSMLEWLRKEVDNNPKDVNLSNRG